ncbi:PQQ-dependent sugar dehydrogenase [Jhaorihella thermophila]|uniref:Glucose/arabinose dehydrogenase, beta-propeller fold n=1 Tax=Jhaorihella thermophila TaxID=488547 RepID=A0A1H5SGM6_9RHOB|nr:PQQ-dependent sugar dehydrogenase [Jhaorihella thermophila]SEF49574.1 Glucose/arabinose dehydrogenase, beta-propeller fold [Jhaorihella thermophila]
MRVFSVVLWLVLAAAPAQAQDLQTSAGPVRVETVLTGLDVPWAIAFLPGGGFLVTEREGDLLLVRDGRARRVRGVPRVRAQGQGGLLDVMVPRDHATTREIFLTFSKRLTGGGIGTAVAAARLDANRARLDVPRVIFEAAHVGRGGRHFGSRIVEASDGTLFVTLGDRGDMDQAQNLANHNGTVVRINRDGSVPADNPFVNRPGVRPEIWSWGHRNPQGAALDRSGTLWVAEHGPMGGDEINRIRKGANYGWPVIGHGRHYSGARIGEGTHKAGMEQPAFYWDPSIAPSDMMIYSGRLWPQWRGHFFVGSLKFDMISHLAESPLREIERIAGPQTQRIRDVAEAPDGSIWIVSEGNGAIYRMSPR